MAHRYDGTGTDWGQTTRQARQVAQDLVQDLEVLIARAETLGSLAPGDDVYERMWSDLREMKAEFERALEHELAVSEVPPA